MAQMTAVRAESAPGLWRRFWSRSNERAGYLFILPSLIHILAFLFIPLVLSFFLSFRDWTRPTFSDAPYIGLENYEFLMGDRRFWQSMGNSAYYTALSVPLGMAFSLAIALVMNQKLRGVYLFRTLFFMPVVSSWVAVSIIWLTLLDPNVGIVNYVLGWFGIQPINWLGDPRSAMPAIVLISIWKSAGFNMVIWLAGLQAIPQELYEAAAIDGANRLQSFRFLTLPLLAPTSFFMAVTGVIGSFQVFTPVYVLTRGGPLDSTNTAVFHIYRRAFQEFDFGYASAQSWVLFGVIFIATLIQLFYVRRRREEIQF
ncbi:MAG: sugar ABC transporter permease [Anaerolineae bacterium]|nr:sugar ABC transporter permease [Anaerolineae bacterium]NUQ03059.1 sugar ABC transporter permease [Anaerolineae bacterium]